MFMRCETLIDQPFEDVIQTFTSPSHAWVPDLTADQDAGTSFVRSELGTAFIGKEVKIYTREAFVRPGRAVIPLRVVAAGPSGLFPELDADLELLADGQRSRLVLQGTYRLPLGNLGELLDRKLLHGLRESSLKSFVERAAEALSPQATAV